MREKAYWMMLIMSLLSVAGYDTSGWTGALFPLVMAIRYAVQEAIQEAAKHQKLSPDQQEEQ